MQIQQLKSSKLFYNKWPYKVECIALGASRIIHTGVNLTKEWCNSNGSSKFRNWENPNIDKADLLRFIDAVGPFLDSKDVQIRAEGAHFNLFCKDKTILECIDLRMSPWIKGIFGPTTDEEHAFLMENGHKKILCNKLPKEDYRYRVYFKTKFPEERRNAFATWSENYKDKLEISPTSKYWMSGERLYTQDPFMYVKDDKTLSLVGMYISGYVKKIEEFILRENIVVA